MAIWVEMAMVDINIVNIVIGEVSVVFSIRAEVEWRIGIVVLVGVAFWVSVFGVRFWRFVRRRTDVLNFSIDDAWVCHRV